MKKRIALLLVAGLIVMVIVPSIAFAQYGPTPTPDTGGTTATDTGGTTATDSGTTYSGGTTSTSTGTSTGKTGAELIVFGLAGAALIGSGYFLTRKAKA